MTSNQENLIKRLRDDKRKALFEASVQLAKSLEAIGKGASAVFQNDNVELTEADLLKAEEELVTNGAQLLEDLAFVLGQGKDLCKKP
jgi:hypothetical protein